MLIAFTGRARSGKDTAAAYIANTKRIKTYSFAEPIRAMLRAGFGLTDWHFNAGKELPTEFGPSPRVMMQTLGTDWGRYMINSDVWVQLAQAAYEASNGLVISDVRFNSEAEWVRRKGGVVIRVLRKDALRVAAHISEAGIAETLVDFDVSNDGTIQELYDELDTLLERVIV